MRALIAGSGPVGMFTALMLARRGHQVLLVDRDPGPPPDGNWARRGVMQFDLPHFFRPLVRHAICEETPELWSALLAAGGISEQPAGLPPGMAGLQCRRSVFERTMWSFTDQEPGITRRTGRVEGLLCTGACVPAGRITGQVTDDRVIGAVVDGIGIAADLVIDATGRIAAVGAEWRAPAEGGPCGFAYAARQYRARPGVSVPDWNVPRGRTHDGYETILFPQDAATLTALIIRPVTDPLLAAVRRNDVFQRVAESIPNLAPWVNPDRFEPFTDVKSGSNLLNRYQGQTTESGAVVPGVIYVGDSVCTTNPAAGRGTGLGLRQAREMVRLIDSSGPADFAEAALEFDAWCEDNIRPWFEDHVYWDDTKLARFAGQDVDIDARIPSDLVCDCAQVDPSIMAAAGPYLGMLAGPGVLDQVQDKARAVLRTGWRPAWADGPTRDELAELVMTPV